MFSHFSATFVHVAHQFGLAGQSVTPTDPGLVTTAGSPYGGHGAGLYTGSLPSLGHAGAAAVPARRV